jgi:hypothetical protein
MLGIIQGQTIRSTQGVVTDGKTVPLGTVTWEAATIQDLGNTYGTLNFQGYGQTGTYSIGVDLQVQCYDIGAKCQMPDHYENCTMHGHPCQSELNA